MAPMNVHVQKDMSVMDLIVKISMNAMDQTNAIPTLSVSIPPWTKTNLVTLANVKMDTSIHMETVKSVMILTNVSVVTILVMPTPLAPTSQAVINVHVMMAILVTVTTVMTSMNVKLMYVHQMPLVLILSVVMNVIVTQDMKEMAQNAQL
jgi:hypothetical protein